MTSAGRGVVVLGMHRGGTSAVAGLLHLSGVPLPARRHLLPPNAANPKGFWEITRLVRENEALLRALGGEWSAPRLPEGWTSEPRVRRRARRALRGFDAVMPRPAWLWKDPRLCLTLPFWRDLGVDVGAAFIVVRNPLETSRSLGRRDRLSHPLGLALWEIYMRSATTVVAGLPAAIVEYDSLLADPLGWAREARSWIIRHEVECGEASPEDTLRSFVTPQLRHAEHTTEDLRGDPAVSPEQVDLWEAIRERAGFHDLLAADGLPSATPWAVALTEERRIWRNERSWRRSRALASRVARGIRRRRRRRAGPSPAETRPARHEQLT